MLPSVHQQTKFSLDNGICRIIVLVQLKTLEIGRRKKSLGHNRHTGIFTPFSCTTARDWQLYTKPCRQTPKSNICAAQKIHTAMWKSLTPSRPCRFTFACFFTYIVNDLRNIILPSQPMIWLTKMIKGLTISSKTLPQIDWVLFMCQAFVILPLTYTKSKSAD